MHILTAQVENYKSFLESEKIEFTPGFNVIVGKNNSGKTALVEALSLQFDKTPHRSIVTQPIEGAQLQNSTSSINLTFEVSLSEIPDLLAKYNQENLLISIPKLNNPVPHKNLVDTILSSRTFVIRCQYQSSGNRRNWDLIAPFRSPWLPNALEFQVSKSSQKLRYKQKVTISGHNDHFAKVAAQEFQKRVYCFKAERFKVGQYKAGNRQTLEPDAQNLPEVLANLNLSNRQKFDIILKHMSEIFPEIQDIPILPINDNPVLKIHLSAQGSSNRNDLLIALQDSGTGIAQVLAILFVVVTSNIPQTIIIDEPQSFLHPGAIRKLFSILSHHYSQHQYIITTHSPTAIVSANPQNIVHLQKEEYESHAKNIDIRESTQVEKILADVGVRLSDVFGIDNVLWVEGTTEELCFPLIISQILNRPLMGTAVFGVINTGDFQSRRLKETIIKIYKRLSEGAGLLPPAVGFIFDREMKTCEEQKELVKISEGKITFTKRRMYENYLLIREAIASVASAYLESEITVEQVESWLDEHKWDKDFIDDKTISEDDKKHDYWLSNVRGDKLLDALFKSFGAGSEYDKVEHGKALTSWIIENTPDELNEIAELIESKLPPIS
ncbi:MAG: AAA family ATPase [Anaerolineales bacterium]|nr:AAA family ATPase [Anaerolineales bacterium]